MSSLPPRAAEPCPDGWLSLSPGSSSKRLKPPAPRVEDDGTPLTDEILLQVLVCDSLHPSDLVRCAATCRRWRRLVSGEAEFICRLRRRSSGRYFRPLAAGFFHRSHDDEQGAPPRFLPFDSFTRRPSLAGNAAVLNGDLFKNCRPIASRNGRLVLELRRASRDAALRIAVLNPATGDSSVLPALSGKDRPGSYACALLTADDVAAADPAPRHAPTAFQLLIVYKRRSFTACRSYSSDARAWGPEGRTTGAKIGGARLGEMDAVIAARGAVFWLHRDTVFSHRIDTLEAAAENFAVRKRCQWSHYFRPCRCFDNAEQNRRLAVSPDGRLCAVQVRRGSRNKFVISIFGRDDKSATKIKWEKVQDVDLDRLLRPSWSVKRVCIRAVCERSGLVFFAAGADGADGYGQQPAQRQDLALYVFDLEKKDVREVRLAPNGCCFVHKSSWSFYGMVSYLSSLAERDSLM